jgi:phage/plasmid primase-like uncharacterized protein/antirestriction protein ArdC
VKQGARGVTLETFSWSRETPVTDQNGHPVLNANGNPEFQTKQFVMPIAWHFTVYNGEEIDGLERPLQSLIGDFDDPMDWLNNQHQKVRTILRSGAAHVELSDVEHAGYHRGDDIIRIQPRTYQADQWAQWALFAKADWASIPARLNYAQAWHPSGSKDRAEAVLRNEIAVLSMSDELGIGFRGSPYRAYTDHWIKELSTDPRKIFRIAAEASHIHQHLMGLAYPEQAPQKVILEINMPSSGQKSDRTYLAVPFAEKDQAKRLGARWDPTARAWYAPPGAAFGRLKRWDLSNAAITTSSTLSPQEQFAEALRAAGLVLAGEPIMNGQLQRARVAGDVGAERSGSYTGYLDGRPSGFIQNFKTNHKSNWSAALTAESPIDRAALAAQAAEKRQARETAFEKQYAAAALEAADKWKAARPAGAHPYLEGKGVLAHGIRQNDHGELLVPVTGADGAVWNLQHIREDGLKGFGAGGRVAGGSYLIGDANKPGPLFIAEGYATGATLHELTGQPVAVAFNAGNLPTVAEAYRARFPDRPIVIAGDNDHMREAQIGPNGTPRPNVGAIKAREAANAVQGLALLPAFDRSSKGTDWNDLMLEKGRDHVASLLSDGLGQAMLLHDGIASIRKELGAERAAEQHIEKDREAELERSQAEELGLQR